MNLDFFSKSIIGSKISKINRTVNLIMFTLVSQSSNEVIHIHVQCDLRLFVGNRLILTANCLYFPGKEYKKKLFRKFHWDKPGATLFESILLEWKDKLSEVSVLDVIFNNSDLTIKFEDEITLEILANVTEYDDIDYSENFRIFCDDKNKDHIIY